MTFEQWVSADGQTNCGSDSCKISGTPENRESTGIDDVIERQYETDQEAREVVTKKIKEQQNESEKKKKKKKTSKKKTNATNTTTTTAATSQQQTGKAEVREQPPLVRTRTA